MNIILGQFSLEAVKTIARSEIPCCIETDLTMIRWPLNASEFKRFKHSISSDGFYWVVCDDKYSEKVKKMIVENSIQ